MIILLACTVESEIFLCHREAAQIFHTHSNVRSTKEKQPQWRAIRRLLLSSADNFNVGSPASGRTCRIPAHRRPPARVHAQACLLRHPGPPPRARLSNRQSARIFFTFDIHSEAPCQSPSGVWYKPGPYDIFYPRPWPADTTYWAYWAARGAGSIRGRGARPVHSICIQCRMAAKAAARIWHCC